MTEAEWQTCDDPQVLLDWLEKACGVSQRKLRLFAVACGQSVMHLVDDAQARNAVGVAQRFADGQATSEELATASVAAERAFYATAGRCGIDPSFAEDALPAYFALSAIADTDAGFAATTVAAFAAAEDLRKGSKQEVMQEECSLVREVFGNPFRAVSLPCTWLTPTVSDLAQNIYAERAFHRLPELATSLEQAGCTDADILAHCHSPGPHVRGCWVVDLLLAKT
jgi:hypothetical protein